MLKVIRSIILKLICILITIYLVIFIPTIWGYKPLVIVSGSMEKVLKVGGILYYKDIDIDKFETGDILVYRSKDHIVSHRVVEKTKEGYITKGDVNKESDGLIDKSNILGKGTNWSIPYIGYYANFIYKHKFILYAFATIVFLDLIYSRKENYD